MKGAVERASKEGPPVEKALAVVGFRAPRCCRRPFSRLLIRFMRSGTMRFSGVVSRASAVACTKHNVAQSAQQRARQWMEAWRVIRLS